MAKYNRLLRIADELEDTAIYAGRTALVRAATAATAATSVGSRPVPAGGRARPMTGARSGPRSGQGSSR
ncbi:MAG: hypothetical protein KatS3mg065_0154 [Chloroflexota bacterium]|nr:MAG: hypothetical protein KatS3mg065_0154 [Chloroflexota bacterium]